MELKTVRCFNISNAVLKYILVLFSFKAKFHFVEMWILILTNQWQILEFSIIDKIKHIRYNNRVGFAEKKNSRRSVYEGKS